MQKTQLLLAVCFGGCALFGCDGVSNVANTQHSVSSSRLVTVEPTGHGSEIVVASDQQLAFRLPTRPSVREYWMLTEGAEALSPVGRQRFEPAEGARPGDRGFIWLNYRPQRSGRFGVTLSLFNGNDQSNTPLGSVTVTVLAEEPEFTLTSEEPLGFSPRALLAATSSHAGQKRQALCSYTASAVNLCADGACTPIQNQGQCGSCWAHAGAGVFENTIRRADWVTRDISEQHILSCDSTVPYCDGTVYFGDGLAPFDDGAVYEQDFPYSAGAYNLPDGGHGPQTACSGGPFEHHEFIDSRNQDIWVDPSCVKARLEAGQFLMTFADASEWSTQTGQYQGGVRVGNGVAFANHVVVIVGYDDTQGVWILRNSWGTGWGETEDGIPGGGGYMRLAYETDAVANDIAYITYTPNESVKSSVIQAPQSN
ncbi:MAG: C1 family peptidase [Archangium sp.]|nr:C1 family peptidase [Archangium sp.]